MRTAVILIGARLAAAADYTTYIGDAYPYSVTATAVDSAGNTYVTGSRAFNVQNTTATLSDVFVKKLDGSGNILFSVTFGGKGSDQANAIALDPSGNIYVAGYTSSTDFPLSKALQSQPGVSSSGFVVKLSPGGGTILYSTYFGGIRGPSSVSALATDKQGNLYLTGSTTASDFPVTKNMPAGIASFSGAGTVSGAFVTEIAAAGDSILYSGLISGTGVSCGGGSSCFLSARNTGGVGIAVDSAGNAYIAGNSNTTDLPTTAGVLARQGIGAFVAKIDAGGAGLGYLTYLGAANYVVTPFSTQGNTLRAIAIDSQGNVYLAGETSDPNFPATPGAYQSKFAGGTLNSFQAPPADAFLAKLKPDASGMAWATFLGGAGADSAQSVAVDATGNVWAVGTTASVDFPNANGWSTGGDFLAGIDAAGAALAYAARYPNGTVSQYLALDSAGLMHTAGQSGIVSAINTGVATSTKIFGVANAAAGVISGRIASGEVIFIYGPKIGPATAVTATPSNGFYPTPLGGVQVTAGGAAVPLLYVSALQIMAVVPSAALNSATVRVSNGGSASQDFRVVFVSADPQIFTSAGGAAALNQDGTINSQSNPAPVGSEVTIWSKGTCPSFYPLADGQVATAAARTCLSCEVLVNGEQAEVTYQGVALAEVAGVTQINFLVPPPLAGVAPPDSSMPVTEPLSLLVGAGPASVPVQLWVTR